MTSRDIPRNAAAFLRFAQGILMVVNDRMGYTTNVPSDNAGKSSGQEQATPETRRPGDDSWTHIPETVYFELREQVNNFETVLNSTPLDSTRAVG